MEVFGLHEYIKDVTRRLAKLGALAVAPDYYFRKGVDLTKITDDGRADADRQCQAGCRADRRSRRDGCLGEEPGRRHRQLGIVGFCRGGRAVWVYAANSANLKAGVAFYGSLVDPAGQKAVWPKSADRARA